MLKKLHFKFVLTNMVLVSLVLLIVFGLVYINTYSNRMNTIKGSLSQSISYVQGDSPHQTTWLPGSQDFLIDEPRSSLPTTTITLDKNQESIVSTHQHMSSMSDSTIEAVIKKISNRDESMGKIPSMHLFYEKIETDNFTYISFASTLNMEKALEQTLFILLALGGVTLFVLFFISLLLANLSLKPAKKAWQQQQQFVADASHELNTPLTVILANENILLSKKNDSIRTHEKWINNTISEAVHMQKLVDNLLFLAKFDATTNHVPFYPLSLSDLALNCILQFEPVAFEKGLELTSSIEPNIHIRGDVTGLHQIVNILLDNACKYSESSGHIHVSLKKSPGGIHLSVHNTGEPIPPSDLPHIFERFYRSNKARTQTAGQGGYGLGLSIAKTIAEQHKGKLTVTSNELKGTKFTFHLRDNKNIK